jgi:hypothetical protein
MRRQGWRGGDPSFTLNARMLPNVLLAKMAAAAPAAALPLPFEFRIAPRTGGPEDPEEDENELLRRLMPIVAAIIVLAALFGC